MSPVPIGILGGTFDPIHNGHLRLAQEALEQCSLGVIRFVPGGTPPHRNTPRASAEQRLDMVRLALHGNQSFELDGREIFRIDPCYTVDTLSTLRAELGAMQPLCLLMGGGCFSDAGFMASVETIIRVVPHCDCAARRTAFGQCCKRG